MAVLVCSHDHDKVMAIFEDRWLKWKLRIWRWRLGEINWSDKLQLWYDYFENSCRAPLTVSLHEGKGLAGSGTPFIQHLKTYLQAKLNYSPSEALAAPLSQAIWDYYTHAELEGSVRIVDREDSKAKREWIDENFDELVKEAERIREEERLRNGGA